MDIEGSRCRLVFRPSSSTAGLLHGELSLHACLPGAAKGSCRKKANRTVHLLTAAERREVEWLVEGYTEDPILTSRFLGGSMILKTHHQQILEDLRLDEFLEGLTRLKDEYVLPLDIGENACEHPLQLDKYTNPYWEILERGTASQTTCPFAVRRVLSGKERPPRLEARSTDEFRILLVVSRDPNVKDIDPRLVSRSLFSLIDKLQTSQVHIDILRPGTFEALRERLRGPTKYSMVHFDLHGKVDAKTGDGVLLFSGKSISGSCLAAELASAQVKFALLNACRSADESSAMDTRSNIAKTLVLSGLETVIGMSHNLSVDAAILFLEAFYGAFLVQRRDVLSAAMAGRKAMRDLRARKAFYGWEVEVDDDILPVLYQASSADTPVEVAQSTVHAPSLQPTQREGDELVGRDRDIHIVEEMLLKYHVLHLWGSPGVGKSTLLQHLRWWWRVTNFAADVITLDFNAGDLVTGSQATFWSRLWARISQSRFSKSPLDNGAPTDLESVVMDVMANSRFVVVLESIDAFQSSTSVVQPLQQAIGKLISGLCGRETSSFVLLTSCAKKPRLLDATVCKYQLESLGSFAATQLACKLLADSETMGPLRSSEAKWLKRILKVISHHPAAIESVLVPSYKAAGTFAEAFELILSGTAEVNWASKAAAKCQGHLSLLCKALGVFAGVFAAVQTSCSFEYLKRQLECHAGRPTQESTETAVHVTMTIEELMGLFESFGVGSILPAAAAGVSASLYVHPLLCHYIRRYVCKPSQSAIAFLNLAGHLHNTCRVLAENTLPSVVLTETMRVEWHAIIAMLYRFCRNHSNAGSMDRRFDLPWVLASLHVHQRKAWIFPDEEEMIADITVRGLQCVLPDDRHSDNEAWKLYSALYVRTRITQLCEADRWLALLMLQWTALYWYDLSRDISRHWNDRLLAYCQSNVPLPTSAELNTGLSVEPFLKITTCLMATELGAVDDSWTLDCYLPVWRALQSDLVLPERHTLFLLEWEQDLRLRLNNLEAVLLQRLREVMRPTADRLNIIGYINEDRSKALDDDMNMASGMTDPQLLPSRMTYFKSALDTAIAIHDDRRIRHLFKCILSVRLTCICKVASLTSIRQMLNYADDHVSTLSFLQRLTKVQGELADKPGYSRSTFADNAFHSWTAATQISCTTKLGLGDIDAYQDGMKRQRAAMDRLLDEREAMWSTKHREVEALQQSRAVLRGRLEPFQRCTRFFNVMAMGDVPVTADQIALWPEHERAALKGIPADKLEGATRILPEKPQPLSDLYTSRPFAVAAQWLTANWYLDIAVGRWKGKDAVLDRFERIGTPLDVYLLAELSRNVDADVDTSLRSKTQEDGCLFGKIPPWAGGFMNGAEDIVKAVREWFENMEQCKQLEDQIKAARSLRKAAEGRVH
ncbi:hypothetical protein LTS10_012703 [Elasticomyces elasticus]|nr:hypothetical protein LTS10_012703 [Elasticomyces elasticus]